MRYKRCIYCGQPTKPAKMKKRKNEYDHASGCPATFNPHTDRRCPACAKAGCDYEQTGWSCDCPCHLLRALAMGAAPRLGNQRERRLWLFLLEQSYGPRQQPPQKMRTVRR